MKGPICFLLDLQIIAKNYQLVIKLRNARGINETCLLNFSFCHSRVHTFMGVHTFMLKDQNTRTNI